MQLVEFIVGTPVQREDGRAYVPISIARSAGGSLSNVVLRVASDAFDTLDEAIAMADEIATRWNRVELAPIREVFVQMVAGMSDKEARQMLTVLNEAMAEEI